MLTGDKQETAISIGYACRLLTQQMRLLVCNHDAMDVVGAWLRRTREEVEAMHEDAKQHLALIIDGPTLTFALTPGSVQR